MESDKSPTVGQDDTATDPAASSSNDTARKYTSDIVTVHDLNIIRPNAKSQRNFLLLVVAGIGLFTVVVLVIMFLINIGKSTGPDLAELPSGNAAQQSGLPAGWQARTSAKLGVSFGLPAGWHVSELDYAQDLPGYEGTVKYTIAINSDELPDDALGVLDNQGFNVVVSAGTLSDVLAQFGNAAAIMGLELTSADVKWNGMDAKRVVLKPADGASVYPFGLAPSQIFVQTGGYVYSLPDRQSPPAAALQATQMSTDDYDTFAQTFKINANAAQAYAEATSSLELPAVASDVPGRVVASIPSGWRTYRMPNTQLSVLVRTGWNVDESTGSNGRTAIVSVGNYAGGFNVYENLSIATVQSLLYGDLVAQNTKLEKFKFDGNNAIRAVWTADGQKDSKIMVTVGNSVYVMPDVDTNYMPPAAGSDISVDDYKRFVESIVISK